ncbi:hypothetical protein [Sphingobacterium bovistauri]|uniref:Lipocalin-like domain-containing protein n=1 Tax=Sphingobacterium bovistauri TaxID=2781959 RepID=A0ABS7Z9H0_9SPHI|nr:hypothetical protein [Sphingobacterium bovistauri]MCA5006227.1 hypothetical protein [Sphingobacterium bovistauri]
MRLFSTIFLFTVLLGITSCSKDSDDSSPVDSKEALKVTVTSSSTFTNDNSDIRVSVGASDSNGKFMKWVVNGANGTDGQVLYNVSKEYFYGGKTAVLQSPSGYLTANINISAFAISAPFTLTYKVEKGNKVVVEKTESITPGGTAFTLALNY